MLIFFHLKSQSFCKSQGTASKKKEGRHCPCGSNWWQVLSVHPVVQMSSNVQLEDNRTWRMTRTIPVTVLSASSVISSIHYWIPYHHEHSAVHNDSVLVTIHVWDMISLHNKELLHIHMQSYVVNTIEFGFQILLLEDVLIDFLLTIQGATLLYTTCFIIVLGCVVNVILVRQCWHSHTDVH